jgi:hypothetical protein
MAEMATLAVIGFDIGKDVWTPSTTLMSPCVVTIAGDIEANWAFATLVLAFDTIRCHANEANRVQGQIRCEGCCWLKRRAPSRPRVWLLLRTYEQMHCARIRGRLREGRP